MLSQYLYMLTENFKYNPKHKNEIYFITILSLFDVL